jgi:cob(I)alamin adenosyltransferase
MTKIYTRTGDKGKTSLIDGKRVLKSDPRVETYGAVDELNSVLGVVVTNLSQAQGKLKKELEAIQHDLFEIGAYLANPSGDEIKRLEKRITEFEQLIDQQTQKLPALRNFILPGGGRAGASLHQARTVCRRAERQVVALLQKETVDETVMKYLNRLSDLLFSIARFVNHTENKKETIWIGSKK